MLRMKVMVSPSFTRTIQRFTLKSKLIVGSEVEYLVRSAQKAAQQEAKNQLTMMVYTQPLPESAGPGYLATRRLGTTFNAVYVEEAKPLTLTTWEGVVRVKIEDFAEFSAYYPWVLDAGADHLSRARPFWITTVQLMRIRVKAMGVISLKKIKGGMAGVPTGGSATLSVS